MSTRQEIFENYDQFVDKFKPKLTTDDCYTPNNIYNAISEWVAKKYHKDPATFCRPFYPGGDYENYNYTGKIVVDNPPFSILSKIVKFYVANNIEFYLFSPSLVSITALSELATAIVVGCGITYENGANVKTSFVTNLEPHSIRMKTEPELFAIVEKINKENVAKKKPPTIQLPANVLTSSRIHKLNDVGLYLEIPRAESIYIRKLDEQHKTDIYGAGLLVSDRIADKYIQLAQRRLSIREQYTAPDHIWHLSDREQELITELNKESDKNGRI